MTREEAEAIMMGRGKPEERGLGFGETRHRLCYRCNRRAEYMETGYRHRYECGAGYGQVGCEDWVPVEYPSMVYRDGRWWFSSIG
jgi:hypothetical protein